MLFKEKTKNILTNIFWRYMIQKEKLNNWIKSIFGFAEDMLFILHMKISTVE